MIKVIFSDLGGVLIVNKAREVGEKYEKLAGLTPKMTKATFRFIQTAKRSDYELKDYLDKENIKFDVWKRFTADLYASESRNDDLVDLLVNAKKIGILVVYTTNNSEKVINVMRKYQIDTVADLVINSSEANVAKPDPEYWRVAFKETSRIIPDIKPQEILVIDDSQKNCISAEEFGFRAFLYENSPESQIKIESFLI